MVKEEVSAKKPTKKRGLKLNKLGLLLVLAAIVYIIWEPTAVPIPAVQTYTTQAHEFIFNSKHQELFGSIKGITDQAANTVSDISKTTTIPSQFTGFREEIVVEDAVASISSQLQTLTQEQLLQFKRNFCADLYPSLSATPTP